MMWSEQLQDKLLNDVALPLECFVSAIATLLLQVCRVFACVHPYHYKLHGV